MDRRARRDPVHGGHKESEMTEGLTLSLSNLYVLFPFPMLNRMVRVGVPALFMILNRSAHLFTITHDVF